MVIGRAAPGDQRLRGRVGIITGAASGIGAAGADLFAAHGAALVLLDQDPAGGQRVADAITARHGRAVFLSGDAASADDVTRAVRTATERFGKLDLLWANAGTGVAKTVPQTTLEEWNRVLAVNLTGAFLLAKYGFPELAAGGGGTMVITGSANSFAADRSWAAYCASKGGLLMLCRALALDHAADGIRVNLFPRAAAGQVDLVVAMYHDQGHGCARSAMSSRASGWWRGSASTPDPRCAGSGTKGSGPPRAARRVTPGWSNWRRRCRPEHAASPRDWSRPTPGPGRSGSRPFRPRRRPGRASRRGPSRRPPPTPPA